MVQLDFNTSYVVIKLIAFKRNEEELPHFNTSYVVIKQDTSLISPLATFLFQYILCCY